MKLNTKGLLAGIVSCILFGVTVVWTKESLISFHPVVSSLGRIIVACLALTIFGLVTRSIEKIQSKHYGLFLLGGLFLPFLSYVLVNEGVERVDAILAGIILATNPLFSPIAARIFLKEKFTPLFFGGLAISFVGVLFAIANGSFHVDTSTIGVSYLFTSVLTYVLYTVIVKKLSKDYSSFSIVFYTSLIGCFFLLMSFFLFEFDKFELKENISSSVMAIIYLGVFGSFLGYVLFTYSIKTLGVGRGMVLFNIVPISSTISAVLFLGESLTIYKLIGVVLVISGLYLSLRRSKSEGVKVSKPA